MYGSRILNFSLLLCDFTRLDNHGFDGHVAETVDGTRFHLGNLNRGFQTLFVGGLTERGVLTVEVRQIFHADKELRRSGIRVGSARHRHHAGSVAERVAHAVSRELSAHRARRGLVNQLALACLKSAALNHKPGNHAVKAQTVVEAVLHKPHKILHRFGRVLAKQLEVDFPAVRQRYTNFVLCHCHSPRGSRAADFSESPLQ